MSRKVLSLIVVSTVAATLLMVSGCWNDDCDPACEPGSACYYGVCLSRAFCPELGPCTTDRDCPRDVDCVRGQCEDHADNCASYDALGDCEFRVNHGICERGYACVCHNDEFNTSGECTSYRECRSDGTGD